MAKIVTALTNALMVPIVELAAHATSYVRKNASLKYSMTDRRHKLNPTIYLQLPVSVPATGRQKPVKTAFARRTVSLEVLWKGEKHNPRH